jgi:hypothetical protein
MLQIVLEKAECGNAVAPTAVMAHLLKPTPFLGFSCSVIFVFRKVAFNLVKPTLSPNVAAGAQSIGPVCGLRDSLFGWFKKQPTAEEVRPCHLLPHFLRVCATRSYLMLYHPLALDPCAIPVAFIKAP